MSPWVYNPHAGGRAVPEMLRRELAARLEARARACFGERFSRLEVRFRGPFCYLDLYEEPEPPGG